MVVVRIREKSKTPNLVSASIKYCFCYFNPLLRHLSNSQSSLFSLIIFFLFRDTGMLVKTPPTSMMGKRMLSGGIGPNMGQGEALLYQVRNGAKRETKLSSCKRL